MLPKEAIEEFKKLYLQRFKVQLTDAEASFRANNLVNLYKFVYSEPSPGPIPADDPQYPNQNNDEEK